MADAVPSGSQFTQIIAPMGAPYVRLRVGGQQDPLVPGHEPVHAIGVRYDGAVVALVFRDPFLVDASTLPFPC